MCKRKYREYLIQIRYFNGMTDNIEFSSDSKIEHSNYQEMLSVYRKTKEKYSDVKCTIEFLGVTDDEQLSVMFSKEIKPTRDTSPKVEHPEALIEELQDWIDRVDKNIKSCNEMMSFCDKQISEIYHKKFECIDGSDITDDFKIKIYDEIRELYIMRRD